MRTGLILTGGKLDLDFSRSFLSGYSYDKLIAVDGGLAAADALGLTPDYIVGDFDTVDQRLVNQYREIPYIVWESHRPEKDETDTELARDRALAIGCTEIVFLGATGGRIDHMLGNLHCLYACMQKGVQAYLEDAQNRIYLLDEGKTFRKSSQKGEYISFLPYTDTVKGITLSGFRYPLTDKTIRKGEEVGLCISNEILTDTASLSFAEGVLVCIESKD